MQGTGRSSKNDSAKHTKYQVQVLQVVLVPVVPVVSNYTWKVSYRYPLMSNSIPSIEFANRLFRSTQVVSIQRIFDPRFEVSN